MLTTTLLSWPTLYLLPHPLPSQTLPLGPPSARPLLFLRGIAGAIGIWGFYYSLRSLALSEATMINFLSPTLAAVLLSLLPAGVTPPSPSPSPAQHFLAGGISLAGATCVLQPWTTTPDAHAAHRSLAIGAALVGVAGGAVSYIAIARLGTTVHPLLTLGYFSSTTVVVSTAVLVFQWQPLHLPSSPLQWALTLVLGVLGFAMHWLMTAALAWDGDAKRPLNFVYTQIVFAMAADKVIWDVAPDAWKYIGGALIIGSAVFVASTGKRHQYALVDGEGGEEEDELELERGKERVEVAKDLEPW